MALDHHVVMGQSPASIVRFDGQRWLDSTCDVDASIVILNDLLDAIEERPTVRAVILSGLGSQAGAESPVLSADQFRRWNKLLNRVCDLPAMTIGAPEGVCSGRAFQLAACCDFRVCAVGTRFSCAEARAGHMPGLLTHRLTTLAGSSVSKRIVLAGEIFDAVTAEAAGLVDYVVEASKMEARLADLAGRLSSAPPRSVNLARRLINEASETRREAALGHHIAAYYCCLGDMVR